MFNFKSNLKKRNFFITILLVGGFLMSDFESQIKSNDDFTEAGISIFKWEGFLDGNSSNDKVYLFGFKVYDAENAATRKAARQARRAARRAAKQ